MSLDPSFKHQIYSNLGVDTLKLLQEEKLALFLDIDNTIIHGIITEDIPYHLLSNSRNKDMFLFEIKFPKAEGEFREKEVPKKLEFINQQKDDFSKFEEAIIKSEEKINSSQKSETPTTFPTLKFDKYLPIPHQNSEQKPLYCFVKPRPGIIPFLRSARTFFKIYICTFGSLDYASEIRDRLNIMVSKEDKTDVPLAIESLIISREIHREKNSLSLTKDIKNILRNMEVDFDERFCISIDDRIDVWSEWDVNHTLLKIHPYTFFFTHPIYEMQPAELGLHSNFSTPKLNLDQSSFTDDCLKKTWTILSKIHRSFYRKFTQLKNSSKIIDNELIPSISDYIKDFRCSVLKDIVIMPFGNIPQGRISLAKYFGAKIVKEYGPEVTHILLSSIDPESCRLAREKKQNSFMVAIIITSSWISDCAKNFKKMPEEPYLIKI